MVGIQHHGLVVLMLLLLRLHATACRANEEVIVMAMLVERAWSAAAVMRINGGPYSSCSLHLIKLVDLLDLLFWRERFELLDDDIVVIRHLKIGQEVLTSGASTPSRRPLS